MSVCRRFYRVGVEWSGVQAWLIVLYCIYLRQHDSKHNITILNPIQSILFQSSSGTSSP